MVPSCHTHLQSYAYLLPSNGQQVRFLLMRCLLRRLSEQQIAVASEAADIEAKGPQFGAHTTHVLR